MAKDWGEIAAKFTIAGVIVGLILLGIAINQINSSTTQLTQTSELINQSSQQIEALNNLLSEISRQTDIQAYMVGVSYTVAIEDCNYSDDEMKLRYKLVFLDDTGKPAPLKFSFIQRFVSYTVGPDDLRNYYVHTNDLTLEELYQPGAERISELDLSPTFAFFSDSENSDLYVRSSYSYRPILDSGAAFSDTIHDSIGYLLLGFSKNVDTGEWEQIPSHNTVCE